MGYFATIAEKSLTCQHIQELLRLRYMPERCVLFQKTTKSTAWRSSDQRVQRVAIQSDGNPAAHVFGQVFDNGLCVFPLLPHRKTQAPEPVMRASPKAESQRRCSATAG